MPKRCITIFLDTHSVTHTPPAAFVPLCVTVKAQMQIRHSRRLFKGDILCIHFMIVLQHIKAFCQLARHTNINSFTIIMSNSFLPRLISLFQKLSLAQKYIESHVGFSLIHLMFHAITLENSSFRKTLFKNLSLNMLGIDHHLAIL